MSLFAFLLVLSGKNLPLGFHNSVEDGPIASYLSSKDPPGFSIRLSSEEIMVFQNNLSTCHNLLSGSGPPPTAGLLVSRPERFPSQSGMRAADSLESRGRMWEISWNVGFFFLPPQCWCNTSASGPPLVFVASAFGAAAPYSDITEEAEEQSGGLWKRSAQVPKRNYVRRDETTCLVWPVLCCRDPGSNI